ncbi:sensor histidine kinase [Modestobacter caceresii]|uniref:sensor histidine kinase n=1 Tax=Modestobacter caceresii TaxID=1522368 RepID=UPI00068ABB1E|nr:PAS domain-containing sensor histidine kinase [Modestobacter caceresii]
MTATPALGRRIVGWGTAVVVVVLLLVDVFLYVALRSGLEQSLQDLLADRAAIARAQADDVPPDALAGRLQELGLRAVVRSPDGTVRRAEPPSPQLNGNLPLATDAGTAISRVVVLPDGGQVEVFARTSGVTEALRRLVLLEVAGSAVAVALAALLLGQVSRVALRPVRQVTAAATRTAEGGMAERLRPDRPATELGRMATAYDAMLDALEAALAEATAAQQNSALLAAVVEGSADAIVTESLDGVILSWNQGAERLYGYRAGDALGQQSSLIVPVDRLSETDELRRRAAAGERVSGHETVRFTRGGDTVEVSVAISPVRNSDGRVVALSGIAHDLTAQRTMTTALDRTLVALQDALDEAQTSEEATRRFLADAAHQLRTPVTGIRACAETLLRSPSEEDRHRLLATMVRETSRAGRLVSSLLQIARLDQGRPLAAEPVDLVALCADEVDRVDLLSPDLDVRLTLRGTPQGRWLLDGAAVREVLSNLLDNGRRHASTELHVVLDVQPPQLVIRVTDDGGGVPIEDRDLIFDRFVSLDGRGGSGLGLPVARGLARAMNGDLRYDAGFELTLPAVATSDRGAESTGASRIG